YSIILLNLLFNELGYYKSYPHLMFVPLGIPFLIGPLHYLYAKYLIQTTTKIKKSDWLHFIFFILCYICLVPEFFKSGEKIRWSFQNVESDGLPLYFIVFNWTIILQATIYCLLTLIILKKYSFSIKNLFSTIEKIKLNWLRNITYAVIIVMFVFFIENLLLLGGINLSNYFNLTSFLTALYIYTLGYFGFLKSEIFAAPEINKSMSQISRLNSPKYNEQKDTVIKYEKSGLSSEKAKLYLEDLLNLMEQEKPYRNSELTLNQLAEIVSISPHNLSEVINTQLNQNFFDFVNQYRVEKVKKDLVDPEKQHLKILSLAFDAGFNSKTSFNTIFKKFTNLTPTEYRNQKTKN
ncbi:MAG: helix-turn-helix domain-containing protein, partial [Calditrichales bacterium]|nr:helix-turn-helix domain-containing protein [Calditrichales bacterium]